MSPSLRQQVLSIAALLAIVVVSALLYASHLTYEEQVRYLRGETFAMTTTVVAYLERNLDAVDDVGMTAVRHPAVQALRPDAAGAVLRPLVSGNRNIQNAVIADASGRVIAWAVPVSPAMEEQLSAEWLASVAASGKNATSQVLGDAGHTAHAVFTAYPIHDGRESVVGVLALAVHLEALEEVFANVPLPPNSVITITDERSMVVARSLDSDRYVGRPADPLWPRPLANVPPTDVREGLDGVERVYGNAVVPRGPWLASVGIPTQVARARIAPIDRRNFSIMLGALGFVLMLSLLVTERSLSALTEVGRAAERVSKGDLSPLAPKDLGSVELTQLHRSVAGMITNLAPPRTPWRRRWRKSAACTRRRNHCSGS